jgi:hypothetical protein
MQNIMKHTILSIRKKSLAGRLRSASCVALFGVCTIALFCSKDYNPFSDIQNARAHVLSCSFAGQDSISVYTTGTLEVGVALREKVDSFTVCATHNRFWPDTTVKRPSPNAILDADPFTFSISFCDTGMETVSVHTHRSTGGIVTENLFIRSTLPLRQSDVRGFYGDTIVLSTPPVADKDVFYQWEFGPGRLVKSSRDSAVAVLVSGIAAGTGSVLVTDLLGGHATPRRFFSYSLNDTSHPVIRCVNDGIRGDTLVTRDSLLAFKAEIKNYGDRPADSCWVNQSAFDISYPQSQLYIRLFKDISMNTRLNPLLITVYAIGNKQFPLRRTEKTFRVIFDPTGVSTMSPDINFIVPLKDSSGTATREYTIFGIAHNYRSDSIVLRVKVNDSLYQASRVIAGTSGSWEWQIHLDSIVNSITVTASGINDTHMLASKHVVLVYDSTQQDRIKPVIWEIGVEGADGLITRQANVALHVIAFDEGSGIQSVTINGAAPTADSSGYLWRQTIALAHSPLGNRVAISAVDRNQNKNDTVVTIFQNTLPELDSVPAAVPAIMYVGNSYTFRISCKDADNDTVRVIPVDTPATMVVSRDGAVSWTPAAADAGRDSFSVLLYDGYESTGPFTWTFACIDSSKPVVPVRFTTRENAFPAVLQAGSDTLAVRLLTDSNASGAQLRYSATFTDRPEVLFTNDTSPLVVWAPGAADTGFRRLRITVGNGSTVFDTINPALWVVPGNHYPCSLSHTFTGDTTPTGELDLFSHPAPETLFFAIHDSDDISTEKYTVTISQHAVRSVAVVNQKNFIVVVRPDSANLLDTLLVLVTDMTGTAYGATLVIRNMNPALKPYAKKLRLNTTATGANVTGNVIGFPVLIRLNSGNFDFSLAQKDGGDIRFSKPNGFSLPFEIERFDAQNGIAEIWVRIDTVFGNDSAHAIGMSWGLPAKPLNPPDHNVFDTAKGFAGVWHLNETNGTTMYDATIFSRNGTKPTNTTPLPVQGIIGGAQNFSGTTDWINLGANRSFVNNVSQVTMSAWIRLDSIGVAGIAGFSVSDGGRPGVTRAAMEVGPNGELVSLARAPDAQVTGQKKTSSMAMAKNADYYVATVIWFNLSRMDLYINGVLVTGTGTIAFNQQVTDNINSVSSVIGSGEAGPVMTIKGLIDEVEVARTARNADWLKLCYMNQKAVDALVMFK